MSIIYHSNVTAYVTDCLCRYKAQHLYKSVCLLNLLHRFYYLGFVFPSHYNFVISRHGQAWSGCGSLDKQEDKAGQQHKYWSGAEQDIFTPGPVLAITPVGGPSDPPQPHLLPTLQPSAIIYAYWDWHPDSLWLEKENEVLSVCPAV